MPLMDDSLNSLIRISLTRREWKQLIDFADENKLRVCDVASAFIAARINSLRTDLQDQADDPLDQMQIPSVIY